MYYRGSHEGLEVEGGKIVLPEGFFSGPVKRLDEEGCLYIVPQGKSRVIVLLKEDMEYAGIENLALIIGCGFWYETWNSQRLKDFEEETESIEEIAERLNF